jgi:hypothetical protein
MNYLLAILCPPLSLLFSKQPIMAVISGIVFAASIVLVFVVGIGIFLHILNVIATWLLLNRNKTKAEFAKLKKELQAEKTVAEA